MPSSQNSDHLAAGQLQPCQLRQQLEASTSASQMQVDSPSSSALEAAPERERGERHTELQPQCDEEMAQEPVRNTLWATALELELTHLVISLPS